MTVEAEVFVREQLGREDDLTSVVREVLHHVIDRFEHADFVLLRRDAILQPLFRDSTDHRDCFCDSRAEPPYQFFAADITTSGELRIALACVGRATDALHDPLPQIAAEMQHEISGGVLGLRAPPPNLLVVQLRQTGFNSLAHLAKLSDGTVDEQVAHV